MKMKSIIGSLTAKFAAFAFALTCVGTAWAESGYNDAALPAGPDMSGDVINVTAANAQYTLDGAYGSINGKTINFTENVETVLDLGRPTKYQGSGTAYYNYVNSKLEENPTVWSEDISSIMNSHSHYYRTLSGVTFTASDGVSLAGFTFSAGHVASSGYDYVRDLEQTSGITYYKHSSLSNITFKELTFTKGRIDFKLYQEDCSVAGVTMDGCTFNGATDDDIANKNAAIKLLADSQYYVSTIVKDCSFSDVYQGVYISVADGATIKNNTISRTTHNAFALQSSKSEGLKGEILIEENLVTGAKDRAIRLDAVAATAQIAINNNIFVDSGDDKDELIKAGTIASGATIDLDNNYWDGEELATAVNSGLPTPTAVGINGGTWNTDVTQYLASGASMTANGDGTYTVADPYAAYVKVADGFYQNAATYAASTDFYITNLNGLKFFRDIVNGETAASYAYFTATGVTGTYPTTPAGIKSFHSNNMFGGRTVHLLADIDLAGEQWISIGFNRAGRTITDPDTSASAQVSKCTFYGLFDAGIYDGEGNLTGTHEISNLDTSWQYVPEAATLQAKYQLTGLFGQLSGGTTEGVKNLTIRNATVVGRNDVGVIAGRSYEGGAKIENCHVIGNVNVNGTGTYVGGLVGECRASIVNSSVDAEAGSSISGLAYVGGLAGSVFQYNPDASVEVSGSSVSQAAVSASYSGVAGVGALVGVTNPTGSYHGNVVITGNEANNVSVSAPNSSASNGGVGTLVGNALYDDGAYAVVADNTVSGTTSATAGGSVVTVKMGAANDNIAVGTNVQFDENGKIKGGIFEVINAELIASGYLSIDNPDSDTNTSYPLTIDGPFVAVIYDENGAFLGGYGTLKSAFDAVNNYSEDSLVIKVLQDVPTSDWSSEVDLEWTKNVLIDTPVAEGVTINLNNVNLFAADGKDMEIGEKVTISMVGQFGSYQANTVTLNGNVNAYQFWSYQGAVILKPSAKATFYYDGQIGMWGGGDYVIEGNLQDAVNADVGSLTPQLSGGFFKFFFGNSSALLKDSYVRVAYAVGDSREKALYHGNNFALTLTNSILSITETTGLNLQDNISTISLTGSRIIANSGTVTINANDTLTMDWKSSITAKNFNNTGRIVLDMDGFDGTLPLTLVTTTGNAAELGDFEILNAPVDMKIKVDENGNLIAVEKVYVAQIGDQKFETLAEAVEAVPENGAEATTIQMIADVELDATVTIPANKNVVLDLNGKTVSGSVTVLNVAGTLVIDGTTSGSGISSTGDETIVVNGGTLTVDGGSYMTTGTNKYVFRANDAATVTIDGCTTECAEGSNLKGFLRADGGSEVVINDATVDIGCKYYVFDSRGASTITVKGGTFVKHDGREYQQFADMKQGNIAIEGGSFTFNYTGTGLNGTGLAPEFFVLNSADSDDGYTENGKSVLTVSGGTFTGLWNNASREKVDAVIEKAIAFKNTEQACEVYVSGGTYNYNPENWVGWETGVGTNTSYPFNAEGYEVVDNNDNTYTIVSSFDAQIVRSGVVVQKGTLSAMVEAAQDGDTIQLLKDVALTTSISAFGKTSAYSLAITKSLTIDGQGLYKITSSATRGIGVGGDGSKIDVAFKDIVVETSYNNANGNIIETRGNIGTLTLDHATLTHSADLWWCGAVQIGGNQADKANVVIKDSTIDPGREGYPIVTWNPVNLEVTGSTLTGYCATYMKGSNGSAGSGGSTVTISNSTIVATNPTSNYSFGAFVFEIQGGGNDNTTIDLVDSTVTLNAANVGYQYVLYLNNGVTDGMSGNTVNVVQGDKIWGNGYSYLANGGVLNLTTGVLVGGDEAGFANITNRVFTSYGYIASEEGVVVGDRTYYPLVQPVAQIGTIKYETFADAIDAAEEYYADNHSYPEIVVLDETAAQSNPDWKIADGKLVHKTYVAQIVETGVKYENLMEAIDAAYNGGTVELLADVTVNRWHQNVWSVEDRDDLTYSGNRAVTGCNGLTINGNGHSLTINSIDSGTNGNQIFRGSRNLTVSNITINAASGVNGIGLKSGLISDVTFNMVGSNPAIYTSGSAGCEEGEHIEIRNCTFNTDAADSFAIYSCDPKNGVDVGTVISGNTFNTRRSVALRSDMQFLNNKVNGEKGVTVAGGSTAVVSGNYFSETTTSRSINVYPSNATIENNVILGPIELEKETYETAPDLSGNYWGGDAPANLPEGVVVNSYYTTYSGYDSPAQDGSLFTLSDQVVFVAKIGNTGYATLAEALKAANSGDVIEILDGTWGADAIGSLTTEEKLAIRAKSLTIQAAEGATPKFTADVSLGYDDSSTRNASIVVKGLAFENALVGVGNYAQTTVENCSFVNSPLRVIESCASNYNREDFMVDQVTIKNCTFDGTPSGEPAIRVRNSGNLLITGNIIENAGHNGILLESNGTVNTQVSKTVIIENNEITEWNAGNVADGGRGIRASLGTLAEGSTVTVEGNTFRKEQVGLDEPDFVKISGAGAGTVDISGNDWNDMLLSEVSGNSAIYSCDSTSAPVIGSVITTRKEPVAQIGTTKYATLAEAFAAVQDGETIRLIADVTDATMGAKGIVASGAKTVTLDLAGFNATCTDGSVANNRMIKIADGLTLNVVNTAETQSVMSVLGDNEPVGGTPATLPYGVFRAEVGTTLNINGGEGKNIKLVNGQAWGLNVKLCGATATLNNIEIESTYGGGIEVTEANLGTSSQAGRAELTDCVFTQTGYYDHCSTALSVSGGSELVVNSGTYTSKNYGLYVFSSGGRIVVKDGTFEGAGKAVVKAEMDTNTYPAYTGAVQISGGRFKGALDVKAPASMSISGGVFTVPVADGYCAEGCGPADNTDAETKEAYPYTVGKYVAQNVQTSEKYFTLAAALDAAQDGQTVKLLADAAQNDGIIFDKAGSGVILDLDCKTFTVNTGANCNNRAFRIDNGTLTVKNGSIVAAGSGTTSSNGAGCYGAFRVEKDGTLNVQDATLSNSRPWGLNVKICGGRANLERVTINSSYGGGIEVTEANLGASSQAGRAELTDCVFTQTGYYDHCSTALSVSGGSELVVNSGTYTSENYGLYVFSSGGRIVVKDGTFEGAGKAVVKAAMDTNTYPAYTGAVQISGGRFKGALDVTSPASMSISGGVFTVPVADGYCAEGYIPGSNTDAATKADYPYTVTGDIVYPVDSETAGVPVPVAWIKSNTELITDGAPINVDAVIAGLDQNGENGVPLWQSYVLGLNPKVATSKLAVGASAPIATATGYEVTVKGLNVDIPSTLDSGTKVAFRLEEATPAGAAEGVWTARSEPVAVVEGQPQATVKVDAVAGKLLRIVADIVTVAK